MGLEKEFGDNLMKIEIYQDPRVFEAIKSREWNALLESSATNVIFLTWEWQATWWRHLTPGEMLVITFRDNDDKLQAIIPLFLSVSNDGSRALSIIGCEDVSDYLDFIIRPEQEASLCAELLTVLTSDRVPAWDRMVLCNLPQSSTAYRVLPNLALGQRLSVNLRTQAVCPVISLPSSWEQYLSSLDKKQRHEIRRKIRRAETEAVTNWYVISHATHELVSEMESFIELHRLSSPEKNIFMDTRMHEFFSDIAVTMADRDWLHLSFIEMQGERAAGMLSFDYNGSLQVYNSGYAPDRYAQWSPGIVLLSYCIQDAIARGRSTFDFLRGEEEYKYRFGAQPNPVYELTIAQAKNTQGGSK